MSRPQRSDPPATGPEADLAPGTRLGRYEVRSVLGRGGMAVVYLVQHLDRGTFHALKRLLVPGRDLKERLLREGRVQSALRHPNVVPVTDVLDLPDGPGLVMEYVGGPTLTSVLQATRLAPAQREVLARGVLRGVAAAHAAGLVHRDLKPDNVLLAVEGGAFVPKVTDFGLAKQLSAVSGTRAGSTMGTPAYMAPEQIRDAATVDARADVFSLGALLYELISGKMAFPDAFAADVWMKVMRGDYPRLDSGLAPRRQLDAVYRALSPDPAARFADATELLAAWCRDLRDEDLATGDALWPPEQFAHLAALGPGTPEPAAPLPSSWADRAAWLGILGLLAAGAAGVGLAVLVLAGALAAAWWAG